MTEEKKAEQVEQPVPAKKAAPDDDLANMVDDFMGSMTAATHRAAKAMLSQFTAKVDAAITKLDAAAGGTPEPEPPAKKPD